MHADEAATALEITVAQFKAGVAEGNLPQPCGTAAFGAPLWSRREIEDAVEKKFGKRPGRDMSGALERICTGGMLADEAAAALQMTMAEFATAVADGTVPKPTGYFTNGMPMWSGRAIGQAVRERLGPLGLADISGVLTQMNTSAKGAA